MMQLQEINKVQVTLFGLILEVYMQNQKKKHEIIIFILLASFISISVICDVLNVKFITLAITNDEFSALVTNLFGIQASVSTLGIALLALLLESTREKRYGLRVGHFLMTNHYKFFTHQSIILFEIAILFLNYIFLVFKFLNGSVSLFITSLFLVSYLTHDILKLFIKKDGVYKELQNHIIFELTNGKEEDAEQILKNLNNHLIELAYEHKLLELKENFEIYYDIYNSFNKKRNNLIEVHYEEVFKRISYFSTRDVNEVLYNSLLNMYKRANEANRQVNFDNNLLIQMFDILSSFPQNYFYKKDDFPYITLYEQIRINENLSTDKVHKNSSRTVRYVVQIYNQLFQKVDWEESFLKIRMKGFHDILIGNLKRDGELDEVVSYVRVLLDNKEKQVLESTFFSEMEYSREENLPLFNQYCLSILTYCFYILLEDVNSSKIKNLQPFVKDIVLQCKPSINEYLYELNVKHNDFSNLVQDVTYQVGDWEVYPDSPIGSSSKWLIMDKVIRNFFMDLFLHKAYRTEELSVYIQQSGYEIDQLYNDIFLSKDNFQKQYVIFSDLFIDASNTISEQLETAKKAINRNYISKILYEAEEIDINFYQNIASDLGVQIQKEINYKLDIGTINEKHLEKKVRRNGRVSEKMAINLLEDKSFFKKYFFKRCNSIMSNDFLQVFDKSLIKIIVAYQEKEKLKKLFAELPESSNHFDTLLGSLPQIFFYEDSWLGKYQLMLEKTKYKVELNGLRNEIFLLNSNDLEVRVKSLSVTFVPLTKEEILVMANKVGSLYQFDDSRSGRNLLFEEDELIHLASLKYRNVIWDLEIEYGFNSNSKGIYYKIETSTNIL